MASDQANAAILLSVGKRRSARPRDEDHPFGYGAELYFWSLIVAVLIHTPGEMVRLFSSDGSRAGILLLGFPLPGWVGAD
jgi:hypothetical protein